MTLEDLQPDATVRGILPDALATVVNVTWHGSDALTMLPRQPLRCLIVCPGSLAEQWQDELHRRFHGRPEPEQATLFGEAG